MEKLMEHSQIELRLSKNLKYLIKDKGITVVALSKKTGIPLQTLHGWLSGVEPKKICQLKKLSNYLSTSIDDLCFKKLGCIQA
jgi:predicted transcriptional regulator